MLVLSRRSGEGLYINGVLHTFTFKPMGLLLIKYGNTLLIRHVRQRINLADNVNIQCSYNHYWQCWRVAIDAPKCVKILRQELVKNQT
jgi:sRNA-binding carbon storage regulator CsrA